eukprot:jgi/Mesen1/1400/ME000130S00484
MGSLQEGLQTDHCSHAATLKSIRAAQERIAPYIHKTIVMTSSSIDAEAGRELFFKCEIFQKGGAFKFRGACNAVLSLSEEDAQRGVVTHSSGNHAAAVALAAGLRGVAAHIVVPESTPQCKKDNVVRYGGRLRFCANSAEARVATARAVEEETGAVFIPPYNDARVISGQGTIALELLEQVPDLDAIIVPVSGGGMVAGIAVAAKALNPSIRVFAAEPSGADDVWQSKACGELRVCSKPRTMADGLRAASMGSLTWPIIRDLVDSVITVEEEEIVGAMRMCFERLKVVVEPSGAVGLAAALSPKFTESPEWCNCRRVGIILCGGNVDLGSLWDSLRQPNIY